MEIPKNELFSVLQEFNPWWSGQPIRDLPDWERSAVRAIREWIRDRETRRSLLLTGARQVGKTTLYRQAIRGLVAEGFPPTNILYATFDHPLLKLAGLDQTLSAWTELFPPVAEQPLMLFLDEIQYIPDWQTWLKHQVDFNRRMRIAVTGSAAPLQDGSVESGVGRWETIPLATLSFGEYLRLRKIETPNLPEIRSLRDMFEWQPADFARVRALAKPLTPHFHEYLLRGGFPEPALVTELTRCQRLLREDIVDKVLKRDMTALYNVRRVLEVEKIFLYLCYHDGGMLDIPTLTRQLEGVNRQTALNFLALFEATHLIYRLKPYGYGKEVLRGRDKVYLADAALPGAMLLLGRRLLEQPDRLGAAVETAFFKHVFTRYYAQTPRFSYWRDTKGKELEVDLVAEIADRIVPFEVKYQDAELTQRRLKGLRAFLQDKGVDQGYVVTRRWEDFGIVEASPLKSGENGHQARILAVPAPLACYCLSA
ncbi:MAG: ATP-binding protein [Nevskiales bacterium]|nr:ATP-binding protein [Nevskiales bacterium]